MMTKRRILLDVGVRVLTLAALSEAIAEAFALVYPDDDGLGTGLTVMFALVCASAAWGLWDGFHREPLVLCVTWMATGFLVSVVSTIYRHLRFDGSSWEEIVDDLPDGLLFWAGLIFVPAIVSGIVQSISRSRTQTAARARADSLPRP